jgi:hypothetical protein
MGLPHLYTRFLLLLPSLYSPFMGRATYYLFATSDSSFLRRLLPGVVYIAFQHTYSAYPFTLHQYLFHL